MGGLSLWHIIIVALVILVLFGRGKVSDLMGDFGKGVSSFKKGISEADEMNKPAAQISPPPPASPAESVRTPEEEAAARRDPGG
jgi:sec-independent protein translocase protein TatA